MKVDSGIKSDKDRKRGKDDTKGDKERKRDKDERRLRKLWMLRVIQSMTKTGREGKMVGVIRMVKMTIRETRMKES